MRRGTCPYRSSLRVPAQTTSCQRLRFKKKTGFGTSVEPVQIVYQIHPSRQANCCRKDLIESCGLDGHQKLDKFEMLVYIVPNTRSFDEFKAFLDATCITILVKRGS